EDSTRRRSLRSALLRQPPSTSCPLPNECNGDTRVRIEGSTKIGEASVHWRKDGSGPPVVFLHGFPLSGRTWDKVVSHLRDRFTCYTADLIGLGESHSNAADDHSSQGQARALQRTLLDLGVDSYALVGNDTGGWIARELALI